MHWQLQRYFSMCEPTLKLCRIWELFQELEYHTSGLLSQLVGCLAMLEWTSKVNVSKPGPGSVPLAEGTIYSHCCSKSKRCKAMTGTQGKHQNNKIKAGRFYLLGFQIWAWWKWLNNRKKTDWLLQTLQYNILLILLLGRKHETSVGSKHPPAVFLDKEASWCNVSVDFRKKYIFAQFLCK